MGHPVHVFGQHVSSQQTWLASVAPLPLDVLLAKALSVALSVQRAGEAARARGALLEEWFIKGIVLPSDGNYSASRL